VAGEFWSKITPSGYSVWGDLFCLLAKTNPFGYYLYIRSMHPSLTGDLRGPVFPVYDQEEENQKEENTEKNYPEKG
jgi:hypothetical protein